MLRSLCTLAALLAASAEPNAPYPPHKRLTEGRPGRRLTEAELTTARRKLSESGFVVGAKNTNVCPSGSSTITTFEECKAAYQADWNADPTSAWWDNVPQNDSVFPTGCNNWNQLYFFNTAENGAADVEIAPVCTTGAAPEGAAPEATGGEDPVMVDTKGEQFSLHGEAKAVFNIASSKELAVNARFLGVTEEFRTEGVTENVLGEVGVKMCVGGTTRTAEVAPDGAVVLDGGKAMQPGTVVLGEGSSLTLRVHRCSKPKQAAESELADCAWSTSDKADDAAHFTTPHRQLLVEHQGTTVEVNVNYLRERAAGTIFPFLEVQLAAGAQAGPMHGLLGQKAGALPGSKTVQVGVYGKQQATGYVGGLQGEGMIEGVYTDYMERDGDLFGSNHGFNEFQC